MMILFLFNLNENKKYIKLGKRNSINCEGSHGPYAEDFGIGKSYNTMNKIVHYFGTINDIYENASEILPSKEKKYYDLLEVEIFKLSY